MELATKGLIGVALLAATVAPATALAFGNKSSRKAPFSPKPLTDYRSNDNKDKYFYYFTKLFVEADSYNKEWWDNAFSRLSKNKSTASEAFKKVESGFNGSDIKLSSRCSDYYNKTYNDINDGSKEAIGPTVKDFWKYCTVIEEELELVTVSTQEQTKIKEKHKDILIAAEEGKNSKFWDIQNKAFFETNGLGASATSGTTFNTLYTNKTKTLRETCLDAYETNVSNGEEKDILAFCSISNKRPNSQ